jgi:hypothetical protein
MDVRSAIGWAYLALPFIVLLGLFGWVMLWPPKSWANLTPGARALQRAEVATRLSATPAPDRPAQSSSDKEQS